MSFDVSRSLTPNDLTALSNLAVLVALRRVGARAGVAWPCLMVLAAGASLLYHAVETDKFDLGSHQLPGARWAPSITHREESLLQIDRACAALAVASTILAGGGLEEVIFRFVCKPRLCLSLLASFAALAISDFGGVTGWTYAIIHSVWHISIFPLAGELAVEEFTADADPVDILIVGLGNPGFQYEGTRHNIGFTVVEKIAAKLQLGPLCSTRCWHARTARLVRSETRVLFACPDTYMNRSGKAVARLCKAHGITSPDKVVIVHDELDLPPGRMKLKLGGGEAGHNGLRSVAACLGTSDFVRVRVGVGKPPKDAGRGWVLERPVNGMESDGLLSVAVQRAGDALESLIDSGLEATMNTFNGKRSE